MTDPETDGDDGGPDESDVLVPYPVTDGDDVATELVRDAVRVTHGEMSDVAFYEKYRGAFDGESTDE